MTELSPKVEEEQITKLRKIKEQRDFNQVKKAIKNLRHAAEKDENIIPFIIEAARCYATIEEMQGAIREAFGYSWEPWGMRESPF